MEEVFKALCSKYRLLTREARTRLTNIKRDTKLLLDDHATEIKKLVKVAYADLPRYHQEEMTMDLFCNSLNHAYLQRHTLAIKPGNLVETVEEGSEYLQIKSGSTYGANFHQIDEDDTLDQACTSCATKKQEGQLAELLNCYQTVFSKNNQDVRQTELVHHSIPTTE